jgi:hypothetical protein
MGKTIKRHFGKKWTREEVEELPDTVPSLVEYLGMIENWGRDILAKKSLPTDWHGENWSPPDLILREKLESLSVDWESQEGYAARVSYQCWLIRRRLMAGDQIDRRSRP